MNLKEVNLVLDCENGRRGDLQPDPEWDDFDSALSAEVAARPALLNGHLKRAIVNSALDETLTRDIYSVLNARRTKDRLKVFRVRTCNGSSFNNTHTGDLMMIVDHISREYEVRSIAQENGKEDLEVRGTPQSGNFPWKPSNTLYRKLTPNYCIRS